MSNSKIYVRFDQVSKSYDGNVIIDNLSLDIKQGEFMTMLGPSGSGKSTCLMMLAGFEQLSQGNIYINNQSIANIPAHKRNIGMVFQNYALFPHMTIEENLAYPLQFKAYSSKKTKEKVAEFLSLVHLDGLGKRYPAQLSGGQKQRVALARALIYSPKLVLMDEPLGALDKNLRDKMQYEIKKLHQILDFTMVYVTHDQSEALTMSDRIVVLDQGIVQQLSDTKTLYDTPNNQFVAKFIGENNQFNAQLKAQNNKQNAQVVVNGVIIGTNTHEMLPSNQTLQLFIRPEHIILNQALDSNYNQLSGKIIRIIFIGDHYRIILNTPDKQEVIVRYQGGLNQELKVNNKVSFSFLPEHCITLPSSK